MTNFPGGVASFGVPVLPQLPGGPNPNAPSAAGSGPNPNIYFVSSVLGQDGSAGKKIASPLATLKQALTLVLPGDTIYLMPGHVESVAAAAGIDVTVKNITVIGLGSGNQRATIVFKTSTAATFRVNATTGDGFYLYNVRVQGQVAAQVVGFVVAAKDVTFDTVDYYDDGTNDLAILFQITGINCTVKNCFWSSIIAQTATLQWITLNAAHGFRCYNNFGYVAGKSTANPANGIVVGVTALSKFVDIRGNYLSIDLTSGTGSITLSLFSGTTGLVAYNGLNSTGKTAIAGICAIASAMGYQNFVTHTANKSGLLDPVADA